MPEDLETKLRGLPKVGDVLEGALGRSLLASWPRGAVVEAVRGEIDRLRTDLRAGRELGDAPLSRERLQRALAVRSRARLQRVINATGVVLHTNLGRAPLAEHAIARVVEVARGYSNLEYDLGERGRGSRHDHVAGLLCELTGAEAAIATNNCAAAVLVALSAIAQGGAVVVSRGELVEIGGGFRIPDVMAQSGARLIEVGTTNRTRIEDYARALDAHPDVRLIMKVHRSNFAIVGFTEDAAVEELAALAHARGLPLFVDLGAGALAPIPGLPTGVAGPEPTVPALIERGADLVAFSGDKLLGAAQAGILVGSSALIDPIARHPLMRAVRPDKLTLAALEGTLQLHRDDRTGEIPTIAMLSTPEPTLEARARGLAERLRQTRPDGTFEACRVRSMVGGGALTTVEPWSWAVAAALPDRSELELDAALVRGAPPVIGRIAEGRLLLDVRTLLDADLDDIAAVLTREQVA